MSKVINYLECGCAILKDGSRNWCPTCSSPPAPTPSPLAAAVAEYFDAIAISEGPQQAKWQAIKERAKAAREQLAKLAGVCRHPDESLEVGQRRYEGDGVLHNIMLKCKKCGKVLVQA